MAKGQSPRRVSDPAYIEYRLRYLPSQLQRARARVRHLETEARRFGLTDLLAPPPHCLES